MDKNHFFAVANTKESRKDEKYRCFLKNRDDDLYIGVSITAECNTLKTVEKSPERLRITPGTDKEIIYLFFVSLRKCSVFEITHVSKIHTIIVKLCFYKTLVLGWFIGLWPTEKSSLECLQWLYLYCKAPSMISPFSHLNMSLLVMKFQVTVLLGKSSCSILEVVGEY